jgi:hypothetical protein
MCLGCAEVWWSVIKYGGVCRSVLKCTRVHRSVVECDQVC